MAQEETSMPTQNANDVAISQIDQNVNESQTENTQNMNNEQQNESIEKKGNEIDINKVNVIQDESDNLQETKTTEDTPKTTDITDDILESKEEKQENQKNQNDSDDNKQQDTSSLIEQQQQQQQKSDVVEPAPEPQPEPRDSVTEFVSGLTPFIAALEDFDALSSSSPTNKNKDESKTNNENMSSSVKDAHKDRKIEEMVMRPIRELIYKSFSEPSEGEEGIEYVLSQLQNLTLFSKNSCNTDLVVRSIGHFLSMSLPPSWIDSMSRWMLDRMQLILLKFFTFKHYCSCYFNSDIKQSRLFVLQCALHRRFPLLISEGCASLARSPVFYGTKQCSLFNDNNYIRCSWQLLQTGASFKVIPLHRAQHHRSTHHHKRRKKKLTKDEADDDESINMIAPLTMDLRTLEQEIERDQSKGRLPCVVIASYTDNLQKIKSICDRHGLWLHIEGGSSSLLLAAATTLPKQTRIMMSCADSISCQPFKWFTSLSSSAAAASTAAPSPSSAAAASSSSSKSGKIGKSFGVKPKIRKNKNNKNVIVTHSRKSYFGDDVAGCTSTLTFIKEDLRDTPPPSMQYSDSDFVMMFPLWHLLVTRSIKQIKNRVDHSLHLCSALKTKLLERKNIFTSSLLSSSLPQIVMFQITPNINVIDLSLFKLDINTFHELLVNRCGDEISQLQIEWKLYDDDDVEDEEQGRYYYYGSEDDNNLNDQSGGLHHDDAMNDNITPYFRFEPLSYSVPELIKTEYISQFIQKIVVEINILRKCLELRRSFKEIIDEDIELQFVDVSLVQTIMVGLGAFRFVPAYFANNINSECIHILNKCLCDELNNMTNDETITQMFKLSMDINGLVCIVINPTNMVFEENCISSMYTQISKCYQNMKYPQEVMEEMAQAIRAGIDNAQKVVENQVNADYTPDSLVRKIPILGSVYGWLLPTDDGEDENAQQTGVGFQIGVGMTKPNIQRHPQQKEEAENDENTTNNDDNNDNEVEYIE